MITLIGGPRDGDEVGVPQHFKENDCFMVPDMDEQYDVLRNGPGPNSNDKMTIYKYSLHLVSGKWIGKYLGDM